MPERRLLALSYAFPPIAWPEAALSAKRLAHLPGWKADVIAAARFHPKIPHDTELLDYAETHAASVTRLAPAFPALWPLMARLGRFPDAFRFLNGKAVRTVHALGVDNFDVLLSWSQYHSIHLAARRIKSRYPRLPWVAHFSDPWIDNPFVQSRGIERAVNRALERSVIEAADRVLFTTPETLDLVMAKYPSAWREKARVIPHGFEPALYPAARVTPDAGQRIVLRYVGNFYGPRTPKPLFRALEQMIGDRPALVGGIRVEIVGALEPGMADTGALPDGLVTFRPPVGYRELLRLMTTADILLVVDAPFANSVFLPSKLVDYLGTHRPIVALSPDGASARALRELGQQVAHPDNSVSAASALLAAIDGLPRHRADTAARARYSAATTGAQLAAVLNELVQ